VQADAVPEEELADGNAGSVIERVHAARAGFLPRPRLIVNCSRRPGSAG
jgi:hypothetical protein